MKISRVQQDPRVSDQDVKSPARSKRSRCQESGKSQESGVSDQDTRSPVLDWNAARGFVLKFRENYREKYLEIFSSLWFQTGRRGPGCGAERIHCTWLSQGISVELNYPHRYSERERKLLLFFYQGRIANAYCTAISLYLATLKKYSHHQILGITFIYVTL